MGIGIRLYANRGTRRGSRPRVFAVAVILALLIGTLPAAGTAAPVAETASTWVPVDATVYGTEGVRPV